MEDDAKSMIESARRMARRLAKKTTTPYQTCLDEVARQLGREHWATYMRDPVPVPRATAQDEAERTGKPVNHDGGVAFPPALSRHMAELTAAIYSVPDNPHPLHNALHDIRESPPHTRNGMVRSAADIMMGGVDGSCFFEVASRDALVAFMHWEMATAKEAGTPPSISGMIVSMRASMDEAGRKASVTGDRIGEWLTSIAEWIGDSQPEAKTTMERLASMGNRERAGVFGAMDRALSPFAMPWPAAA